MPERTGTSDVVTRWNSLTKAELWAMSPGEIHNWMDEAVEEIESLVFILRDLVTDEKIGLHATGELWARARAAVARYNGSGS